MNHLIIYAHVNDKSFSHAIKDVMVKAAEKKGDTVKVRDLNAMKFNPILSANDFDAFQGGDTPTDIKTEQDLIEWADVISFIYPLWWGGMPAIMKGYLDRVFSYGFAYTVNPDGTPNGMLTSKKVVLITPLANSIELYEGQGFIEALNKVTDIITFAYVGITDIKHLYFGNISNVSNDTRIGMLNDVKSLIESYK